MSKIPQSCTPVNARTRFEKELLDAEVCQRRNMEQRLTELLLAVVRYILVRPYHVRRVKVPKRLRREGRCSRCGSSKSRRFIRNGFRKRQLLTCWGELEVDLPRVRCECGGSVRIDFGDLIRPYQRIWDDVDVLIQRWGALALSLRQMRQELEHLRIGALALRTLNRRLHQLVAHPLSVMTADIPPSCRSMPSGSHFCDPMARSTVTERDANEPSRGASSALYSSPWASGLTVTGVRSCSGT
jgi:hypothetical protein